MHNACMSIVSGETRAIPDQRELDTFDRNETVSRITVLSKPSKSYRPTRKEVLQ